jgi:hypothetical protein
MAPAPYEVETVPEDDSVEFEYVNVGGDNTEVRLGQDTQHSQATYAALPENDEEVDDEDDTERKPAASAETRSTATFEQVLDTFISKDKTARTMWSSEFQAWDNAEELGIAIQNSDDPTKFKRNSRACIWAGLGEKWDDDNDADYIASQFNLMYKGSEQFLEAAESDKERKEPIPRAYLTRLNQKDQFQIVHSRGKVRTPSTEEHESKLENTWIAFVGDTATTTTPSMVSLGKKPSTVPLFTVKSTKLTNWQSMLQEQPSETGCFGQGEETFSEVPTMLPLPWAWAATIASNPQWNIQDTCRYLMLAMYGWLRESDKDTIGLIMKFLLGATTAKTATAKKSNPKVMLPTKVFMLDEGASAFVAQHIAQTWTALENKPRHAKAPRRSGKEKQSPSAGASKPPIKRTTTGTKRPSSDPQRGTRKTPKVARAAPNNNDRPQQEEEAPSDPTDEAEQDQDTSPPQHEEDDEEEAMEQEQEQPTTPTPGLNRPSIITPELIASLRDNPATMQAVIDAILDKERQEAQHNSILQSSIAAVNNVAIEAIKAANSTSGNTTGKGKWNPAKQARFAGYCGLAPDDARMPSFWKKLIQAASDDKEAVIQELLNDLAERHDEFRSWIPPPHVIDDIKRLNLQPVRTEKGFFRGLSPLAFADRDQTEIHQAQEQRKLHSNYIIQLTGSDAEKLEAKAPPMPQASEKLQLYLKRWTIFLKETMSGHCELVREGQKGWKILQRQLPRIMSTPDYMRRRGNSVLWELSLATDDFFRQIITMTNFDMAAEDPDSELPRAHCEIPWNDVLTIHGPPAGDLPSRLKPPPSQPAFERQSRQNNNNGNGGGNNNNNHNNGNQNNNGGGSNNNNNNNTGRRTMTAKGNWPAPFKTILGEYEPTERQKLSMKAILKDANHNRNWFQEQLGINGDTCFSNIVFGQCPEGCTLNHDAVIDSTKLTAVANKLKTAIKNVARQRNIRAST